MGKPRAERGGAPRLATKLQGVLLLVAATVVLVAGVGYLGLRRFEERMTALYEGRVVPLRALKEVSDRHAINIVDTVHKVCAGRLRSAEGAVILTDALAAIDAGWSRYGEMRSTPADLAMIASTTPMLRVARGAVLEAREDMRRDDVAALDAFRRERMYPEIDPLTVQLNELVDAQVRETDAQVRRAREALHRVRIGGTVALLIAGLAAVAAGFAVARRLAQSVQAIEVVVRAAAGGDLSKRAALGGDDELSQMAADVDGMVGNLERAREELIARGLALEASEREARAANAAKSVFLSSMSHELRTPLNVILGYTQLLLRDGKRSREEKVELQRIMEAGNHLLGLIEDVLSITKVEAGTLVLRRGTVAPQELLRSVAEMLSGRAEAKGITLSMRCAPSVPAAVEGDEQKLRQVLVNLVANAVKFTARGGVEVSVTWQDDRLAVAVTDSGPGIAPSDQEHLFESFYQGDQGHRAAEGSGLGLYISQSLVRLMAGAIHVRSEVGKGAEFSFSIAAPAVRSAAAGELPISGGRQLPAGLEVGPMLVVDDRESNRDVLGALLHALGVAVVEASTGEQALELWERSEFSVVWMDLHMPGMGGVAALARVRERERQRGKARTKTVAITASVIEFDREMALRAGFDDMIPKPFRDEELFRIIERLLGVKLEAMPEAAEAAAGVTPGGAATAPHGPFRPDALSPEQVRRLLAHLERGENDDALRLSDEIPDAGARASLRAVIETFQVDDLLIALRAAASA